VNRPTYEQLEAALRYLGVLSFQAPHINIDIDGNVGMDDAEDVWCLGCTLLATTQMVDMDPLLQEDGEIDAEAASGVLVRWDEAMEEIFADPDGV